MPSSVGSTDRHEREDLHEAFGGERVVRVHERTQLVYFVPEQGTRRKAAASSIRRCVKWVRKRLTRYARDGLTASRGCFRSECPRVVKGRLPSKIMGWISLAFVTPHRAHSMNADALGVMCHPFLYRRAQVLG